MKNNAINFMTIFTMTLVITFLSHFLVSCAESGLYPTKGHHPQDDTATTDLDLTYDDYISNDIASVDTAYSTEIEDIEEEVEFFNIAPFATPSAESSLYDLSEWALIDNNRAIGWYSDPQWFDWNETWVQLEWEDRYNILYLEIFWDDDLYPSEIEILYRVNFNDRHKWNELADYEPVSTNYSKFLLAKEDVTSIIIRMLGSSNMLSTYSIKEIEVTAR